MRYLIEMDIDVDDESEARKIARIIIDDAEQTFQAFRHQSLGRAALLRPRPGDGTGFHVVPL